MRAQVSLVTIAAAVVGAALQPVEAQPKIELPVQRWRWATRVVENWPRPLPDRDLSHAGGRGARAPACWRKLPTRCGWRNAAKFNCRQARRRGSVLSPESPPHEYRTPPYSGKGYPTRCDGTTWSSPSTGMAHDRGWLQHDRLLAPPRGSDLARSGAALINCCSIRRSGEAHLDRGRRSAHHQHLHEQGRAGADDGRAGRARTRPEQFQPPDRHRLAARRHVLRGRQLRRHPRGEVRSHREVREGLGPPARRSEQPRPVRVLVGSQHRHQPRPAALRRRPRAPSHAGVRRDGKFLECGRPATTRRSWRTSSRRTTSSGWPTDDGPAVEMRPQRPLHPGYRRAWTTARQFDGVHQISVDQIATYVTEVANDRSQKFRPKPDADPARSSSDGRWGPGSPK